MMLPKSYTSPSESTSPGSIFRKLYSCPFDGQTDKELNAETNICSISIHSHIFISSSTHACSKSTLLNVVSDDAYMLITVRTCVFMPEANHVAEFMHNDAKLITVFSYRDGLRAATSPPHIGATPAGQRHYSGPHPAFIPPPMFLTG